MDASLRYRSARGRSPAALKRTSVPSGSLLT
jgi:hypothetical protein